MFESAALGRSYPAKEYAALENALRMKLFKAQGTCIEHKLPVLITIAGVDGSAKSGSSWVVGMVAPSGVFVAEISARGSSMRRWNAGGGLSIRWRHPGLSSSSSGFISERRARSPVCKIA